MNSPAPQHPQTPALTERGRCAVRLPADAALRAHVEQFIAACSQDTTTFLPKDDDELDAALSRGDFARAVFGDVSELLEVVWKGRASLLQWRERSVAIEFVNPPPQTSDGFLEVLFASLSRWRARRRRRQIAASLVLAALALAALVALFTYIPPPS